MRTTSPPFALPIAAAACALLAAVLALLAVPSAASAARWLRPVPGEVARSFSYARDTPFAAGAHRGVDLDAPPGAAVRAACGGRVVHAGSVAGRVKVASVSCGVWRVSYMPLTTVAVHARGSVRAGALIGTVASGHGGLHVGVRHERDRFGYEDPITLLAAPDRPSIPALPPPAPRVAPPPVPRVAARPAVPRLAHRPAVPRRAQAHQAPRPAATQPAPWPVWAGLALLLGGTAGSGSVVVRRRRLVNRNVRATSAA